MRGSGQTYSAASKGSVVAILCVFGGMCRRGVPSMYELPARGGAWSEKVGDVFQCSTHFDINILQDMSREQPQLNKQDSRIDRRSIWYAEV